jgi:uncharacterized protein (TIGR02466 family)
MIHNLFPTPVGIYGINIPKNINEEYFKSLDISGQHGLVSAGVSSHDTVKGELYLLDQEALLSIKQQLSLAVNEYAKNTGLQDLSITSSWFNIMAPNGKVLEHQHKVSTISGALYVSAEAETCPLVLKNPLNDFKILDIPALDTPFTAKEAVIDTVTGRLILFPSYLMHHTRENNSSDNRIVISFNTLPTQVILNNQQQEI